ncbi:MAG: hypothetical protein GQ574_24430 [Crocinitomix sp.]|nr:hypothetical protein [Crocinitomix sp.]
MKRHLTQILTLALFVFLTNNSFAQNRFGDIECDSFQVTFSESEAIVFQGKKTAVYNKAKQEFLIKPTKSSVLFFPGDNYYVVADTKQLKLYNFYCTDTLAPCLLEYIVVDNILFNTTNTGKITLLKDGYSFGVFPNFRMNNEWALFQKAVRYPNSSIRNNAKVSPFKSVGIERLNDSLLVVINYKDDYHDPHATPIKSVQYPEEDSLIFDSETGFYYAIYPGPVPGYEYCGVYNLNAKNWIVQSNKLIEFYSSHGVLVGDVARHPEYGVDSVHYTFINIKGKTLFSGKAYPKLYQSEYLTSIITNSDTAMDLPNYAINGIHGSWNFRVVKNEKMAIVNPIKSFENLTQFKEFVHYNLDYGYAFWLENDSIYAELGSREYAVSQVNGIIQVCPSYTFPSLHYRVYLIEGEDTITKTVGDGIYLEPLRNRGIVRLEIIDGNLIVNDYPRSVIPDLDLLQKFVDGDLESLQTTHYIENSNHASSVWRKGLKGWEQQTENCRSIQKIDFGFILSKQSYYLEQNYFNDHIHNPVNYFIIDNNFQLMEFNGISQFTAIIILENTIELRSVKESILIDNQGEIIRTE